MLMNIMTIYMGAQPRSSCNFNYHNTVFFHSSILRYYTYLLDKQTSDLCFSNNAFQMVEILKHDNFVLSLYISLT